MLYFTTFEMQTNVLNMCTWNTVRRDCQNVSKLLRGLSSVSLMTLNLPPNNCIPSKAQITMKRNRRSNKLAIERILFNKEATRLRRDDQYLQIQGIHVTLRVVICNVLYQKKEYSKLYTVVLTGILTKISAMVHTKQESAISVIYSIDQTQPNTS